MSAEPLTREEMREWYVWAEAGAGDLTLERMIATVQAAEAGRKAAEERAERLRADASSLRDALDAAEEFICGVIEWTGSHPDEIHEVLDFVRSALAADDAARGEG